MARGRTWIGELDGLRAIASLSVVLAHYNAAAFVSTDWLFPGLYRSLQVVSLANLGVVFFYALSAFLLTFLGVREYDESGHFDVKRFYLRRCFRIWPLYFTILLLDLVVAAPWGPLPQELVAHGPQWSWISGHLWIFVAFLSNWSLALNFIGGHVDHSTPALTILWSIAVEEQFYLVYPLLLSAILVGRIRPRYIIYALALIGLVFRLVFPYVPVDRSRIGHLGGMYYATLSYADVFLAGGLGGWLAARWEGSSAHRLGVIRRWWVGVVLLAGILSLGVLWRSQLWHPYGTFSFLIYPISGIVFAALLLWVVSNGEALACRILRSRPMAVLGALSYGMYMWHPIAGVTVLSQVRSLVPTDQSRALLAAACSFVLYLAITVGAAALTYGTIERPFLRLKTRFASGGEEAAQSGLRRTRRRSWVSVVAGSAVVVLAVELAVLTSFSTPVPSIVGQGTLEQGVRPKVLFVPQQGEAAPKGPVLDAFARISPLAAGNLLLTGSEGQLLELVAEGQVRRLTGREGQRLRVLNIGPWDGRQGMLAGLDATYRSGKWVIDRSPMEAVNRNNRLTDGRPGDPIPGFWISPGDARYTTTRMEDESGSFVRVRAIRPSAYLVINGQDPLASLNGVPVSVRGQIRAQSKGLRTLTLHDVQSEDGRAKEYVARENASGEWKTMIVRAPKVVHPSRGDNFSVGLFGVEPGDWFDVRELSLFVGILP